MTGWMNIMALVVVVVAVMFTFLGRRRLST
jgi:hypothetical protein